jgi:hypothetical protein
VSPRRAERRPAGEPGKPRRAQRRKGGPAAEDAARLGPPQLEEWPDGAWIVRQVPGAAATKLYRCPGCDQELQPGTAHVVVWPAGTNSAEGRRHWHNACWRRRPRRPGPWTQTFR